MDTINLQMLNSPDLLSKFLMRCDELGSSALCLFRRTVSHFVKTQFSKLKCDISVMELAHNKMIPLDVTPDTELTFFVVLHLLAMR